jgi:sarcosine oxidase subunit beta
MGDPVEVAIIGAGVVGASVAFHLSRLGQRGVVVLEREALPGSGSTSRANGGIRAQFTTAINVRMSLASMDILESLGEEIGEPPLYRKAGYLFLTGDAARLEAMAEAAAFQRSLGVDVAVLDGGGVRRMAPYAAGPIAGGTFGARDGFIDPGALVNFLLGAAVRGGVRARYRTEVLGLEKEAGGGFRIHTSGGELSAQAVVNGAGAWASPLAAMLGVELPVVPVRRHIIVTGPCPQVPPVIPMTIDADTGVLVRREGARVVIAYSNPDEPPGYDATFDPDFVERIADAVERRFPAVASAGVDLQRSWAGLYEVTPDHHAILGEAPSAPGFFLVNGFSGHGVMHALAAGRCTAELITRGRADTVDVTPLALDRFARGEAIHETMVL